jgi:uncharacterized protein YbaA (DUF1428 family)
MPEYIDGFLIPVPKTKIKEYQKIARAAGKIWKEYGALDYRECLGDDLKNDWGVAFTKAAGCKPTETAVFSWIVYKSRKDRDRINKKIMADERIKGMMDATGPIFDCKRMAYGGFTSIVSLKADAAE